MFHEPELSQLAAPNARKVVKGFPVLPAPVVGKTVHSPLPDLDTLVENHLTIYARFIFVLLNSVGLCVSL